MTRTWLGLGSNVGERDENLARAIDAMAQLVHVSALSGIYETAPLGHTSQPPFWNMVVEAETDAPAAELLAALKQLETALGRVPTFAMGPRSIDIDILLYGDMIIDTDALTVPHAGLLERAFALVPLLELNGELRDPRTGERLADAAARLHGQDVRRVGAAAELLPLADVRTP